MGTFGVKTGLAQVRTAFAHLLVKQRRRPIWEGSGFSLAKERAGEGGRWRWRCGGGGGRDVVPAPTFSQIEIADLSSFRLFRMGFGLIRYVYGSHVL